MHFDTLTAPEQRVLGCLIEKRFTTPDQYPLSLNALRLAANQSTNRDPVVAYDEATVRAAAQRLCQYELARLASGHTSRAIKYRHLAAETLALDDAGLALLAVLLLRGPQTPGELKTRTERMVAFGSLQAVQDALETLIARGYVVRLERRPGQKEERYTQLLGGATEDAAAGAGPSPVTAAPATPVPAPAPRMTLASLHPASSSAGPADSALAAEPLAARQQGAANAERDRELELLSSRVVALEATVERLGAELRALQQLLD